MIRRELWIRVRLFTNLEQISDSYDQEFQTPPHTDWIGPGSSARPLKCLHLQGERRARVSRASTGICNNLSENGQCKEKSFQVTTVILSLHAISLAVRLLRKFAASTLLTLHRQSCSSLAQEVLRAFGNWHAWPQSSLRLLHPPALWSVTQLMCLD